MSRVVVAFVFWRIKVGIGGSWSKSSREGPGELKVALLERGGSRDQFIAAWRVT